MNNRQSKNRNTLLNRIAKLTMASHNQITENQELKERLEDLANFEKLNEKLGELKKQH